MDSWFTMLPFIKEIVEQGIDVIGMVKASKQRYPLAGEWVDLKKHYRLAQPMQGENSILCFIHCEIANGIPAKSYSFKIEIRKAIGY